ncbi:MAG: hypothetical protein AB7O98_17145 [Hyphomonadaceae bacterium]
MSDCPPPLVEDADFIEVGEQRRAERRRGDRRAGKFKLHPMFAATLIAHVAPTTVVNSGRYETERKLRAGIAFDLRA